MADISLLSKYVHVSTYPRFSKYVYVKVIYFSKGLAFSANWEKKASAWHMLKFFWCFIGFYYYSLKCSWKKSALTGVFGNFLQMSAHQSVCILTNAQFHPSWCDYCLEWSHYTLDCTLSDKNSFSNQNNDSKNHNYFWLFCILKPTWKYYLAGFEFYFVKLILVANPL